IRNPKIAHLISFGLRNSSFGFEKPTRTEEIADENDLVFVAAVEPASGHRSGFLAADDLSLFQPRPDFAARSNFGSVLDDEARPGIHGDGIAARQDLLRAEQA